MQFFVDVLEEAMNEISDYYSHVDNFDANEAEYVKKEQEKQDKADQELRARITEDDKFAKEGYDNIQVKINSDQQPDADFINKLNDISKQAKANAEKEAAEYADTADGSSGAAYTGQIRSGAAKLARYLRDCHFSIDGEE